MPADLNPLFAPLTLGGHTLKNRFVMPSMQRALCTDGRLRPEMADYYGRRAHGGTSLVIGEGCAVDHWSSNWDPQFPRTGPGMDEEWIRCADQVHAAGSTMLLQVSHPGALRSESHALPGGVAMALSPSGLFAPGKTNGRAATLEELAEIKQSFVDAALFAQHCGMDGIELHACHGFFLDQFLWQETNLRSDRYGGRTLDARAHYPAEVVAAIRAAVGADFLIGFRFSQWKEVDYGARIARNPEELAAMLDVLERAGVDLLHPSSRRFYDPAFAEAGNLTLAGWCKRLSSLPVIAVGSVGIAQDVMNSLIGTSADGLPIEASLSLLAHLFDQGEFDLVAIGRNLIADPEWVRKIGDGAISDLIEFKKEHLGRALEMEPELIIETHRQAATPT